jgi:hypothetical protein
MSTRSHIGVRNVDGITIDYIYCHYDGYPKHNGGILINHYQDMDRVNELMKLGDLSSLAKQIGEKQNFNIPKRGWCLAYGRDRGDELTSVGTATNLDDLLNGCVDYVYVFDGEFWECYNTKYRTQVDLYAIESFIND